MGNYFAPGPKYNDKGEVYAFRYQDKHGRWCTRFYDVEPPARIKEIAKRVRKPTDKEMEIMRSRAIELGLIEVG